MLLLLKCFDIKKVKSLNDLVIIDWVLGGKPTKKKNILVRNVTFSPFLSLLLCSLLPKVKRLVKVATTQLLELSFVFS